MISRYNQIFSADFVIVLFLLFTSSFWLVKVNGQVDEEGELIYLDETFCGDQHSDCDYWAVRGECAINPKFMLEQCQKACGLCQLSTLELLTPDQEKQMKDPIQFLGMDLGIPQQFVFDDGTKPEDILYMLGKARNYKKHLIQRVQGEDNTKVLEEECKNKHVQCAHWGATGECGRSARCEW